MPDRTDVQDSKSCAEYYGPYPKYDPVPTTKLADGNGASSTTDYRDVGTPDEWVTRDGEMVRLTGRHPFNSEPPLSLLKKYAFITPTHLHIVRNHGAVPKLKWEAHTLLVGGPLSPKPYEISMDALASMPSLEFPITLSCCGNRRKEINMIKQTIGFNWGAAGVGTNVWKGVAVRELLLKAGITDKDITDGTKHVEFVGFEDLPNKVGPGPFEDEVWGKHVKYGTSIPLGRAMSPQFDVMVAYEANGEKLLPDHGFPCRLIIPGYIGGRMIKWLKEIRVLKHESKNHYHYHDNKILPPTVDAERALKEGWWYRQEYILNELSLNSVIAQPNHNDTLPIARSINSLIEIGGYAHTGGGRPVVRVEISLDQGETWLTTELNRKERPNPYGMYWCWVWWAISIPVAALVGCKEIWCRAWDSSQAPQPIKPTWTLMGQHANHVFRVKVHTRENESGEHFFWFEHPTQPGQLRGGWAERIVEKYDSAGYGRIDYASQ
ncbi:oxidoreductase molybdopterin binding protein [Nitzschia inconspicua]|uniref:Oxidoreductase molybdopterin binding protein n=1 Tax=Nitzschia inconspicua TaxID=303405 RepID=A0A9K3PI94_9STRA|nr:oxidoreductase molybdopterin binding protein [Nitzschia inconspicua]